LLGYPYEFINAVFENLKEIDPYIMKEPIEKEPVKTVKEIEALGMKYKRIGKKNG